MTNSQPSYGRTPASVGPHSSCTETSGRGASVIPRNTRKILGESTPIAGARGGARRPSARRGQLFRRVQVSDSADLNSDLKSDLNSSQFRTSTGWGGRGRDLNCRGGPPRPELARRKTELGAVDFTGPAVGFTSDTRPSRRRLAASARTASLPRPGASPTVSPQPVGARVVRAARAASV
jgi:hypothetical protein